jgi:predicted DCC family thiol-disulfide oxidoreductase YuxK
MLICSNSHIHARARAIHNIHMYDTLCLFCCAIVNLLPNHQISRVLRRICQTSGRQVRSNESPFPQAG